MGNWNKPNSQDGAALVEALVTIPVLAVVLAGILAFHAMYMAKLEAEARGRRVAWLQADSGDCPTETCMGGECRAMEMEIRREGLDDLQSTGTEAGSVSSFLGSLKDFFVGRVTHGIGHASAPMPGVVHAAPTSKRGVTTLLCNTRSPRDDSHSAALARACSSGLHSTEYAREVCR